MRSKSSAVVALTLVVVTVLLGVAPRPAQAAGTPSGASIAKASAYVVPVGCSAVTGTYHVAYLLYDEGAPRRWRTAAYVCGGLSIALGAYILADNQFSDVGRSVLGVLPLMIGSYAILTAWYVGAPNDIVGPMARASHVIPWFGAGSAGLVWSGTF